MFGASIDKVDEASAAVKFGEEDGGIGLKIGVFDPLKARSESAAIITAFAKDSTAITTHPHGWGVWKGGKKGEKMGKRGGERVRGWKRRCGGIFK